MSGQSSSSCTARAGCCARAGARRSAVQPSAASVISRSRRGRVPRHALHQRPGEGVDRGPLALGVRLQLLERQAGHVVLVEQEDRLLRAWRRRARSPSSPGRALRRAPVRRAVLRAARAERGERPGALDQVGRRVPPLDEGPSMAMSPGSGSVVGTPLTRVSSSARRGAARPGAGRRPRRRACRERCRSGAAPRSPGPQWVSTRTPGPAGDAEVVESGPAPGRKSRSGSSALMRHSMAWPLASAQPVRREQAPAATRSCSATRSRPVTSSVTGCSTCRRAFSSRKKKSPFASTRNSSVPALAVAPRPGGRQRPPRCMALARRRGEVAAPAPPRPASGGGAGWSTRGRRRPATPPRPSARIWTSTWRAPSSMRST